MPAQYIPPAQDQQSNRSSETLQLLLLLKRQALEQKIAEHRLNVLGPLEDEFAKTNLDIAKFKLGEMKDTAPLTKQREEVGLRRDTALAQGAEFDTQHAPELLALQKDATQARIGSEKSQQASADVTRRAQEQLIGQREKAFPVEQESARIAQDATRQQIATSKEQMNTAVSTRENQKKELSLQKQQLVIHASQSREGIMLLKNNPDMARDPELSAYVKALPDDVDPKSVDEFRAKYLHNVLMSNDPQLADLKYEIINNLADSVGTGRGDKAQELAKIMGVGGATDVAKSDLANAVGQAYRQTRIQGPSDVTSDTTLKTGALGPEQGTPALKPPSVSSVKEGTFGEPTVGRTEEHIKQAGRVASMSESTLGDNPEAFKDLYNFTNRIPVDPASGLQLRRRQVGMKGYSALTSNGELEPSGKGNNPYYNRTDLEKFAEASVPSRNETGAQTARFTTLVSDLAKNQQPDPQQLLAIANSRKFTRDQLVRLTALGRSVGWDVTLLDALLHGGK